MFEIVTQCFASFKSWLQHTETGQRFALQLVWNSNCGCLTHSSMPDENGFHFCRTHSFTGDFNGIVRTSHNVPQPIIIHRGPVAMDPDIGETGPVRLQVAVRVAPKAACHANPGLADDQLT